MSGLIINIGIRGAALDAGRPSSNRAFGSLFVAAGVLLATFKRA